MKLTASEPASRAFVIALVAVYVVLVAVVAAHHEPWRDEADAWLFARDGDFLHIVDWTRHAGTPALWYFILAPLPRLGFPYASQSVLHLAIAAASIALLAARAPLTRLTKVLVAFSYYFAYEYAVIVRTYALTVLLTFAAAALYSRSRERPLVFAAVVALLFNCNAQGFFIAGAFAMLYVIEHRRAGGIAPPVIMALAALVVYLQVRTPPDPARHALVHVFNRDAFAWAAGNAFFPTLPAAAGFVLAMIVLLLVTLAILRARDALLILWLPLAALAVLYSFVWLGGLRHSGFFLLLAIVAVWLAAPRIDVRWAPAAAIALNAALLFSVFIAVRTSALDIRFAFSGAKEMAAFIRDHDLDRADIAAHNLTQCEALLPYLPHTRFWYAGLGQYGTYLKWDAAFERALDVPYPVAEARAKQHFAGKPWLLLFNVEMPDPSAHGFRLLYATREPVFEKTDERYWLYAPLFFSLSRAQRGIIGTTGRDAQRGAAGDPAPTRGINWQP